MLRRPPAGASPQLARSPGSPAPQTDGRPHCPTVGSELLLSALLTRPRPRPGRRPRRRCSDRRDKAAAADGQTVSVRQTGREDVRYV